MSFTITKMSGSHHVLVLGGHGKIAQMLTPLLLKRSWTVTSVIRTQDQAPTIEQLGKGLPGKLNVLVNSIADVDSEARARSILDEVKPDYVAWSAGAGGKGGPEMTYKIDRDAAIHFANAAASTSFVKRFLLISYSGSRRNGASWWPAGEWDKYNADVNYGFLATYYQAKIAADEALYEASRRSGGKMIGLCLRPGTLSNDPAGRIEFGKTRLNGQVSRESVAQTADALLAADGVKNSWLDLLDGNEEVEAAVTKAVRDGVNAAEGEPIYTS
ncbi:NAD dependent epimerase/dehydratase [Purpureocillium lavendulum]|uniref:NAD dependent epimerase/dehydratase n=1 Tax=Purpureocillium lavendulum TaxID=1247861 RepID=A0AB34G085_9HYPO|nr:NAD dependent epimerase/dehydratase [Purpureocillium lavendulum]